MIPPSPRLLRLHAYDVHGVTMALRGDSPAVRLLDARFRSFPRRTDIDRPDLVFEFRGDEALRLTMRPPGPARPIYDLPAGEVLYSDSRDEMYIAYSRGVRLRCDLRGGRAWAALLREDPVNQWLASHLFFTLAFEELLKRRGLYGVHAAGLGVGGRALILTGATGSGKTTLACALMQAGFDFLADDTLFLAEAPEGLSVLAFPEELDMTPHAGELFPALRHLASSTPIDGPKHRVRPEDVVREPSITWVCRPGVLIFPRIAHRDRSVLIAIDPQEALVELVPNVLLTAPRACQAHLDCLGRLARDSACYRLETGRDFDRLPGLLRELFS